MTVDVTPPVTPSLHPNEQCALCPKPIKARSFCGMHYERVRRNGSALVTKRTPPSPDGRRSRAYNAWVNMRQRVLNPKHPRYANYGGRGIDIDPRWDSYQAFLEDMGEPGEGMSLGRIDNNRGYSLENCRWSTNTAQANNRTSNSVVVIYV